MTLRVGALAVATLGSLGAAATTACAEREGEVDPFTASTVVSTGIPARALAPFDDGDGVEVAAAFDLVDQVRVWTHLEGDELAPTDSVTLGGDPRSVVALDADADGTSDVAVADVGDAVVALLSRGAGGGLARRATTARLDLAPTRVEAADVDGDGRSEIIATLGTGGAGGVETWRLAASGALERLGDRLVQDGTFAAIPGDVDADGAPDLVLLVPGRSRAVVAMNDGAGRFAIDTARSVDGCDQPRAAAVVAGALVIACRDQLIRAQAGMREELPIDGDLYDLVAADVDGDRLEDLAAVDVAASDVVLWLARPDGGFAAPIRHPVERGPVMLRAIRARAGGDVELVVLAYEARAIELVLREKGTSP